MAPMRAMQPCACKTASTTAFNDSIRRSDRIRRKHAAFPFMSLPPELRLMIYNEYVKDIPAGILIFGKFGLMGTCHPVDSWKCSQRPGWKCPARGTAKPIQPLALYTTSKIVHREMHEAVRQRAYTFTATFDPMLLWAAGSTTPGLPDLPMFTPDDSRNIGSRNISYKITDFKLNIDNLKSLFRGLLNTAKRHKMRSRRTLTVRLRLVHGRKIKVALTKIPRKERLDTTKYNISMTRPWGKESKESRLPLCPGWEKRPFIDFVNEFLDD